MTPLPKLGDEEIVVGGDEEGSSVDNSPLINSADRVRRYDSPDDARRVRSASKRTPSRERSRIDALSGRNRQELNMEIEQAGGKRDRTKSSRKHRSRSRSGRDYEDSSQERTRRRRGRRRGRSRDYAIEENSFVEDSVTLDDDGSKLLAI